VDEWSAAHPDDPLCADCSCAHSQPLNCNLKGRAFWWMMARLAGWSGTDTNPPTATDPVIKANGSTNDITINSGDNLSITVQLDPGGFLGTEVDWWVIACAGGTWFYMDRRGRLDRRCLASSAPRRFAQSAGYYDVEHNCFNNGIIYLLFCR